MMLTMEAVIAATLDKIAKLTDQANTLHADLQSDPRYSDLTLIQESISECEDYIKDTLKQSGLSEARVISSNYEAVLQTRHGRETLHYDIQAIEQEPTLATTIVKTVNEKLFKAVIEAKSLDLSMYCTPEAGTETKAVIIRKVEEKKP